MSNISTYMRRVASNVPLLTWAPICWMAYWFGFAARFGDWTWFARSGSIATIAGVLLSVRPIVRMGSVAWLRYVSTMDGGSAGRDTPRELEATRQSALDATAAQLGYVLALGGTIVWAYGDLLGRMLS